MTAKEQSKAMKVKNSHQWLKQALEDLDRQAEVLLKNLDIELPMSREAYSIGMYARAAYFHLLSTTVSSAPAPRSEW